MFMKLSKILSLLTVIALLVTTGAGAALAQDLTSAPGAGPANALMPANGFVQIEPGQWQWYVFRSQAATSTAGDDEDSVEDGVAKTEVATIDAALRVQSGSVNFEVWSKNDLNNWVDNEEFNPTGKGTTNEFMPGDPLSWQGVFEGNNDYYLIVKNPSTQAASYALSITGDVAFPSTLALSTETTPAVAQVQEPVVASEEMALTVDMPAEATVSEPALTTAQLGFDAASAVKPAAGVVKIEPGQWQWYTFSSQALRNIAGDDEDGVEDGVAASEIAKVDAALHVQSGAVRFEVWSLNDLNNWVDNDEFKPTGVGTTNESLAGDPLFWEGTFEGANTFYLIVMNRGTQPATYSLDITGNVNFPSSSTLPVQ